MDFIEDLAPINYYKLRSYLEIIPPCLPRKSIIPPNFIIPPRELCNYPCCLPACHPACLSAGLLPL